MKDISGFDILIILVLFILFSIFLGMKIVSVIDKKISNISVTVPAVNLPKPNIVVKNNYCDAKIRDNNKEKSTEPFISSEIDYTYDNETNKKEEIKEEIKEEFTDNNTCKQTKETLKKNLKVDKEKGMFQKVKTDCLTGIPYKTTYFIPFQDKNSPRGYNEGNYTCFIEPENAGVKLLPKDNKKLYKKYSKVNSIPTPSNFI